MPGDLFLGKLSRISSMAHEAGLDAVKYSGFYGISLSTSATFSILSGIFAYAESRAFMSKMVEGAAVVSQKQTTSVLANGLLLILLPALAFVMADYNKKMVAHLVYKKDPNVWADPKVSDLFKPTLKRNLGILAGMLTAASAIGFWSGYTFKPEQTAPQIKEPVK